MTASTRSSAERLPRVPSVARSSSLTTYIQATAQTSISLSRMQIRARSRFHVMCRIKRHQHAKYPPIVQRTILRIMQEGLANAYRHASASQVSIDVRRLSARLHIIITDNGQGISGVLPASQRPSCAGVGIRGIRMRLTQLGGRLRISAPPEGGTRLHAMLPTDTRD